MVIFYLCKSKVNIVVYHFTTDFWPHLQTEKKSNTARGCYWAYLVLNQPRDYFIQTGWVHFDSFLEYRKKNKWLYEVWNLILIIDSLRWFCKLVRLEITKLFNFFSSSRYTASLIQVCYSSWKGMTRHNSAKKVIKTIKCDTIIILVTKAHFQKHEMRFAKKVLCNSYFFPCQTFLGEQIHRLLLPRW